MKTIDKLVSGVKAMGSSMANAAVKYAPKALKTAVVGAAIIGGSYTAGAQVADEYLSKLPAMDFYSAPNIVQGNEKGKLEYYGSGDVTKNDTVDFRDAQAIYMGVKNDMADVDGNGTVNAADGKIIEALEDGGHLPSDWNKLSPLEKEAWTDKMVMRDLKYPITGYLCGNHTTRSIFNFMGIKKATSYTGIDSFTGRVEDFSRYASHVDVGNKNIPMYQMSLEIDDGTGHLWEGVLIGDRTGGKAETNPFNRDHWKIYNYRDGSEVKEESIYLNENGPLLIYATFWNEKEQKHMSKQLINFKLTNGVASFEPKYVSYNALYQNPHQAIVDLKKKGDIYIEANENTPEISEEAIGKPVLETNLKKHYFALNAEFPELLGPTVDYRPKVKFKDSEMIPFDERYPAFGTRTRTYTAESEMGRWNKNNLENLADTTSFKITVDDKTSPEGSLAAYLIEGDKGSDPAKLAKSLIDNISDASMSYGYPVDTLVSGADIPSFEDSEFNYYNTTLSAIDVSGNEGVIGNAEVKVKKIGVGVPVVKMPEFVQTFTRGNEINIKYMPQHTGNINFDIFNMAGQLIDSRQVSGYPGGEGQFSVHTSSPGLKIIRTIQQTSDKKIVDVDKVVMTR